MHKHYNKQKTKKKNKTKSVQIFSTNQIGLVQIWTKKSTESTQRLRSIREVA